jgi:GTP-binding protein
MKIQKGQSKFLMGIDKPDQLIEWLGAHPHLHGVAFIGRSNVGKSSLINALFGGNIARTSKTPGRTRQVNIFSFTMVDEVDKTKILQSYFFDVPGYGHAEVSKEMGRNWQDLLGILFERFQGRVLLINLQDARHPLQESDRQFGKYLKSFSLDSYLIFNKIDKLKTQKERAALEKIKPEIFKTFKWVKQIYFVSAETKQGVENLESSLTEYIGQYT